MRSPGQASARLEIHVLAYNEEQRLPAMLECLSRQTFRDYKLVIHDNGSTDTTPELCREAATSDGRIRVNRIPFNTGIKAQGLRFRFGCDADYVAMRSANDRVADRYFEETVRLLDGDPQIALAYSHGLLIDNEGQVVGVPREEDRIDTRGLSTSLARGMHVMQRYGYSFPLWGVYRRKALELMDVPKTSYGSDHVIICEIALYGHVVSTEERLDCRSITQNELNFYPEGVRTWARQQNDEAIRGIPESSPFGPFEVHLPFTNLIWGHIDMFSKAFIDDHSKMALSNEAVNILCARFGSYLKLEVDGFLEMVARDMSGFVEEVRAMPVELRTLRLGKLKAELNKLRVIPFAPISMVQEIETVLAQAC